MKIEITEEEKKSLLHWIPGLMQLMIMDVERLAKESQNPLNIDEGAKCFMLIDGYSEQLNLLKSFLEKLRNNDDGKEKEMV